MDNLGRLKGTSNYLDALTQRYKGLTKEVAEQKLLIKSLETQNKKQGNELIKLRGGSFSGAHQIKAQ